jgi:REP element-mobilizing transposase RayT
MVVGYHLVWTAYGWWLPNDPRGSNSHEIRIERIAELGDLHHGRKAVQPRSPELRLFYEHARLALRHALLSFSPEETVLLAEAFAATLEERNYTCYACAILRDHVHMLIRRHRDKAEVMLEQLQADSRERLIQSGARAANHPVWGGPSNTRGDIERVIAYIRKNPIAAGFPEQTWRFVQPYDGWLPRPARET